MTSRIACFSQNTRGEWQLIFMIAACVYLFGTLFYIALGSGEEQFWNRGGSVKETRPLLSGDSDEHED